MARVLSVTRRGLSRQFRPTTTTSSSSWPTGASSASNPPLLVKLLRESESGVKIALDSEDDDLLTPQKTDALFWEPLLFALRSSSPRKAQLVLEWKLEKLMKEDVGDHHGQFSKLISLGGKLENIPFAVRAFTAMEARGIKPNTAVFNTLIHACLATGNVVMALNLFEIMSRTEACKPSSATYNAFISMYSKQGDSKGMMGWYSAGKSAGFPPDIDTYEALIVGFAKPGKFEDTDRIFEEMVSSGVMPNVAILECVLEGLCKQKKLGEVKELWRCLLDGGWDVSERMMAKILALYLELGKVEQVEELLDSVQQRLNSGVLSLVHCGIIRMHALSDRLDEMEYSVGRMLKKGMRFTCSRDVEAVISSYFRCEAYERLDLFLNRVRDSYKLTKSTYDLLIAGYRRIGLCQRLDSVMKDMKNSGFA